MMSQHLNTGKSNKRKSLSGDCSNADNHLDTVYRKRNKLKVATKVKRNDQLNSSDTKNQVRLSGALFTIL